MKVDITIPDSLAAAIDRIGRDFEMTTDQVVTKAVEDFLLAHGCAGDWVTDRINEELGPDGEGSELDPAIEQAGRSLLRSVEWDEGSEQREAQ